MNRIFGIVLPARLLQVGPTWFYLQAELMGPDPAIASVVFSLLQLAGPPELQYKAISSTAMKYLSGIFIH